MCVLALRLLLKVFAAALSLVFFLAMLRLMVHWRLQPSVPDIYVVSCMEEVNKLLPHLQAIPNIPFKHGGIRVTRRWNQDVSTCTICGIAQRIPTISELGGIRSEEDIKCVTFEPDPSLVDVIKETKEFWELCGGGFSSTEPSLVKGYYLASCDGWTNVLRIYEVRNRAGHLIYFDPKSNRCAIVIRRFNERLMEGYDE